MSAPPFGYGHRQRLTVGIGLESQDGRMSMVNAGEHGAQVWQSARDDGKLGCGERGGHGPRLLGESPRVRGGRWIRRSHVIAVFRPAVIEKSQNGGDGAALARRNAEDRPGLRGKRPRKRRNKKCRSEKCPHRCAYKESIRIARSAPYEMRAVNQARCYCSHPH